MITDEMTEKAARALHENRSPMAWENAYPDIRDGAREEARIVLEAVAPIIAARVIEECASVIEAMPAAEPDELASFLRRGMGMIERDHVRAWHHRRRRGVTL